MRTWSNCILGALTSLGLISVAHAYGPGSPATVTARPADYKECAADGKVCKPNATATKVYVLWGADGKSKYATAVGTGNFTCTAKGWVKKVTAATPEDLGVADPSPGVQKKCWIKEEGATQAQKPTTPATTTKTTTTQTTQAAASTPLLVRGCDAYKGAIYNAPAKKYDTMAALNANYAQNNSLPSPKDTATECAKLCAATGEPAPCAWFTVTSWLSTLTSTNKDSIVHVCHMFNDRRLKQISTPSLSKENNLGSPDNPIRFRSAESYACRN